MVVFWITANADLDWDNFKSALTHFDPSNCSICSCAEEMWKLRIAGFKKLYHSHRIQQRIMKLRIRISTNFWPIRTKFSVSFIFYCFFRKKQSDWLKRPWKFKIRTIFGIEWAKYLEISLPMKKGLVFPQLRPFYAHLFGT